jgi:hypothetical protein
MIAQLTIVLFTDDPATLLRPFPQSISLSNDFLFVKPATSSETYLRQCYCNHTMLHSHTSQPHAEKVRHLLDPVARYEAQRHLHKQQRQTQLPYARILFSSKT